ncbi:MAG: EAL domain-containing protein [Solirubrobacteraceae bacterium]
MIVAHACGNGRTFGEEDFRFVQAVADVVGGALDRAATEDELRRRALEDPLSGLANRALLTSELELELELRHARRLAHQVCVITLDLDRFKVINDTLGRDVGDALLRQLASRLLGCVREEDLVAHAGGDEFTIITTRTETDHAIEVIAGRILATISERYEIDGREVPISASVGVALSHHGQGSSEELLRDAEAAMYRAKNLGGARYSIFDSTLRARLLERAELESDLRHALERDEFELHYQPLVSLQDLRIDGFEALLRWRHPTRGLLTPGAFIAIAEETGLIVPIGSWVLMAVCAQLARWPEHTHISANVSAVQIAPKLVSEVQDLLDHHRLTPDRLVLEITESLVLDPLAKPTIANLRQLGVRLALDDVGTGYSSLGALQRFPLDLLKLDRTLTSAVLEPSGAAVVRAALELGHALAVEVIAEGIENDLQLHALRSLGCPVGQGFHFSRPIPAADAEQLLDTRLSNHHQPRHGQPVDPSLLTHRRPIVSYNNY